MTSQLAVLKPSSLTDWLLEHGRHFVTTPEIAELLGVSATSVPVTLHRARTANKIVSVTKGAWVPVPPAHRSAGAPPPVQFIDELMNHLGHPYYIGFLSAARIHGASHQVPMSLQVVTPAHLRDRRIGDHPVRFIRRSATAERATERRQTETGSLNVSTPETTVFDLVDAPGQGAGLGNVANVMGELVLDDRLDPQLLTDVAKQYPLAVAQRAGWILEHMADQVGGHIDLEALHHAVSDAATTPLDPELPRVGDRDPRWRVCVNTDLEHDL